MRIRIPIFPLPEITLFPRTSLPLHVFETRYRQLITDVLAGSKRLAVVGLKPGWEPLYERKPPVYGVAGAGVIAQWERLPSGRYNILLQGTERIKIQEELPTDTLYRVVDGTVLEDVFPKEPDLQLDPLIEKVKRLAIKLVTVIGEDTKPLAGVLAEAADAAAIADRIASAMIPDFDLRQSLLETVEVKPRLVRLAEALNHLLRVLRRKADQGEAGS